MSKPMKPIPVACAKVIATDYGYDQVVIIARRVGDDPEPHGEHVTTYGRSKVHCAVAANIGDFLKRKVMGWVEETRHEGASPQDTIATQQEQIKALRAAAERAAAVMSYVVPRSDRAEYLEALHGLRAALSSTQPAQQGDG